MSNENHERFYREENTLRSGRAEALCRDSLDQVIPVIINYNALKEIHEKTFRNEVHVGPSSFSGNMFPLVNS